MLHFCIFFSVRSYRVHFAGLCTIYAFAVGLSFRTPRSGLGACISDLSISHTCSALRRAESCVRAHTTARTSGFSLLHCRSVLGVRDSTPSYAASRSMRGTVVISLSRRCCRRYRALHLITASPAFRAFSFCISFDTCIAAHFLFAYVCTFSPCVPFCVFICFPFYNFYHTYTRVHLLPLISRSIFTHLGCLTAFIFDLHYAPRAPRI